MKKNNSNSTETLPRISTRSTTFITSTTDDVGFAQQQIDKIDRQNYLSNYYRLKPWEQISNYNIYASSGKSNYSLLSDIRKKVKIGKPIKEINWSTEKSLNRNQLQKVFDASQIMKRIRNNSEFKEPYIDLHTYSSQSREICIRNMLIDLMNDERKKITQHQKEISYALSHSLKELNNDMNIFEKFQEEVRKKSKETEITLNKLLQQNKKLVDKKKKVNQEHRLLLDEIEKVIRMIFNMKYFGLFVQNLLGGETKFNDNSLRDGVDIKNNREKELEVYYEKIVNDFGGLLEHGIDEKTLSDPSQIMNIFEQYEDNIIKLLNQKEDYEIEKDEWKKKTEEHFRDYYLKEQLSNDEYQRILKDIEIIQKQIRQIKANSESGEFVKASAQFITELESAILPVSNPGINVGKIQERKIVKVIDRTLEGLEKIEFKINDLISELEKYDGDPLLYECIEAKKKQNKFIRYLKEKQAIQEREKKAREELENKMNQYIIKGRGRWKIPVPPNIAKNKRKSVVEVDEENHDVEMLEY